MFLLDESNRFEKILDGKKGKTLFFTKLGVKNKFLKILLSNGLSASAIVALSIVGINVATVPSAGFLGLGIFAATVFNPVLFIPFAVGILAVFGIKVLADKKSEGIPTVTKGSSNILYASGLHMVFLPAIAFLKEGTFSKTQEELKQIVKQELSAWGTCEEYSNKFIENYFSEDDLDGDLFKLKMTILDFQKKFRTKGPKLFMKNKKKASENNKPIVFSKDFNQNQYMQKAREYCEELNAKYGSVEASEKDENERKIVNIFNALS